MKYGKKPHTLTYRYSDDTKEELDQYMEAFGFSKTEVIDYLFEFFKVYKSRNKEGE